jgi:hypothetical protein
VIRQRPDFTIFIASGVDFELFPTPPELIVPSLNSTIRRVEWVEREYYSEMVISAGLQDIVSNCGMTSAVVAEEAISKDTPRLKESDYVDMMSSMRLLLQSQQASVAYDFAFGGAKMCA